METTKLINHLRAGFPLFWLRTQEPNRVKTSVYNQLKDFVRKDNQSYSVKEWNCIEEPNPIKPLETLDASEEFDVLFLYNFHWYIDKPQVIQKIQNSAPLWASSGKAIVIVSPNDKIPRELQKDFILMDLPLPKDDEIEEILKFISPADSYLPAGKDLVKVINAAKGLTRQELESVFSLSLVEHGCFVPATINSHKAMTIAKTGFLDVLEPNLNFNDVVGYENLKQFVLETIDNPKAKGIMTIGPPGCGKTSLMKAIVGETGKFGLSVNMGRMFGKYQGETDQNIKATIDLIKSIGNCVVLIDEFEKQFAGASGDGSLDSGTTRRATGQWLEFLQDRPEGIYIVGTANSFQGIPGEYLRPGRWDTSPFFIDLPNAKTKNAILYYYLNKFKMTCNKRPSMDYFTGAEIEALCHIADMRNMDLNEAVKCILPQALTMKENVDALRTWAVGRTIPAENIPSVDVKKAKREIDI